MNLRRGVRLGVVGAVLLALAALAGPALGAPAGQDNLLTNPGFESGSLDGWSTWAVTADRGDTGERCETWQNPQVGAASGARSGSYAARFASSFASFNAGLIQQVSATPGTTYRFTIYAQAISKAGSSSSSDEFTNVWAGIDAAGGTDASAGSITWSGAATPMDGYAALSVEATATGDQITVFTRSVPNWCLEVNEVYWDDASLATTAGGGSTGGDDGGEDQSAPPGDYVLATPDASGRIVHTVQAGDTLSGIAFRYGVPVDQIRQLNNLTSDIVQLGAELIISAGDEPVATTEPAAEATAGATEEAGEAITPSPTPEGVAEVTEEPAAEEPAEVGTVCIMSYEDANANGIREPEEGKVADITFTLNRDGELLSRYTTDGVSEPYCFADLEAGTYTVAWTGDAFEATTEQSWNVEVGSSAIVSHEFGVRAAGETGEQPAAEVEAMNDGLPPWAIALIGAVGAIIVLGGAGAAVYFLVIRRQEI
jgi:LysM repeat protein